MKNFHKHIHQIKRGGLIVIIKKLKSFVYLLLHIPIYLISIPTVIIIRLVRPWFLIRWNTLPSSRIGHFAKETELYCCERDAKINVPSQRYIDLFCLRNKYVCNKQLEKMWRRSITILPTWLLVPLHRTNRFINIFVKGADNHEIIIKGDALYDIHNLLERFDPHINFTNDEEIKGKKILKELEIPEDAKFVCLIVRDSGYLNRHKAYEHSLRDWSYHDYRNGDIDKFVLAAEELVKRGYYVFRMGINVLKPLNSSNPKIIDYANLEIRSDFMDIYLGAKCFFCVSTAAGFDMIPRIFRKPITCIGMLPLGYIETYSKKDLIITKHHINKKNKKKLTISEIFSSNAAISLFSEDFMKKDIELKENSPEEIRDLAIEMDERLNGNWKETREDLSLQKKFWSIFEKHIERLDLKVPLHGKIKAKFGAKYLRNNQDWIK